MRIRSERSSVAWTASLIVLSITIAGGCATKQQVTGLESSVAELRTRNDEIAGEIRSLKDLVQTEHELIMSAKADVLAEISGLREQIRLLENRLTERRDEAAFESGTLVEEGEITMPAPALETGQPSDAAGKGPDGGGGEKVGENRVAYDTAYLDMTRGNYPLAIDGFRSFIEGSGGSQLLDNAQYWIGECYYAQGDLRRAIEEFERVVDNYPEGNKIPSALFKIGKCFHEIGDADSARQYFQTVINGYPRSDEANLAREYLVELGEPSGRR